MRLSLPMKRAAVEELDASALIPIRVQDETNSLVFRVAGFVARSLQIAADMRLARASPAARNPARLSLILNANWNKTQGKREDGRMKALHNPFIPSNCDLMRLRMICPSAGEMPLWRRLTEKAASHVSS